MNSRLGYNIKPQLRLDDTLDQMVPVAEHHNATISQTRGYKGSDRSSASRTKSDIPKKANTYCKLSTAATPKYRDNEKAAPWKRTYTETNKPSKAEIESHKAGCASVCCGESGHIALNAQREKLRLTISPWHRRARHVRKEILAQYRTHRGARS